MVTHDIMTLINPLCLLLCLLLGFVCGIQETRNGKYPVKTWTSLKEGKAEVRRFIVDTDAGSDDAVGLLHLLGAQSLGWDVEVAAIMGVAGNTHVDNVVKNVLKVLDTALRLDVPLYKGLNQSILITPESDNYFGQDGFGDFPYPNPPSEEDYLRPSSAVSALVDMVKNNPGVYSLAVLGPLTNVATALRLYPNLLNDLQDIFILGGSVEGYGNISPGIEFNFYVDPEAAYIVLAEAARIGKQLVVVPCELFSKYAAIDIVQLLNKAEARQLTGPDWAAADGILAAVAADTSLVTEWEDLHGEVETCGRLSRGAVVVARGGSATNTTANIRAVKRLNVDMLKRQLLQTLAPLMAASPASSSASRAIL